MPENNLFPISMPDLVGGEDTFISTSTPTERVDIKYFYRPQDKAAVAKLSFALKSKRPPRCAHGGSIAAVLDECMGAAYWVNGHTVLGARLNVRFRRPVPLGAPLVVVARIIGLRGRTVDARARMEDAETGRLFAEAAGVYVKTDSQKQYHPKA